MGHFLAQIAKKCPTTIYPPFPGRGDTGGMGNQDPVSTRIEICDVPCQHINDLTSLLKKILLSWELLFLPSAARSGWYLHHGGTGEWQQLLL